MTRVKDWPVAAPPNTKVTGQGIDFFKFPNFLHKLQGIAQTIRSLSSPVKAGFYKDQVGKGLYILLEHSKVHLHHSSTLERGQHSGVFECLQSKLLL